MRKITRQRLSESWIEQATKQKVDQKLERDIEKLRSMCFITVDNDNTKNSITLVVIRHALLVVMVAMNLDNLSFVVYSRTAD